MANNLGTNPATIDTAMANPFSVTPVRVSSAIWMSPTTVGHQLIIQDRNGNPLINVKAPVANQDVDLTILDAWWNGSFKVTQIDSGLLVIFF